ncbi:hypothetical protein BSKO_07350 [Bryopsis sp. KO-2023]|nr:hypothetical protein BSKO_07350 [Bryopsis sp. KO-2023]
MNSSCSSPPRTIRRIVLPLLIVALSQTQNAAGRRDIVFSFQSGALADWGLPNDAEVFHTSSAACSRHEPDQQARGAAICAHITDGKNCVGLTRSHALMRGINCKGQRCVLSLDARGSACLLNLHGIKIGQDSAKSNSTNCGVRPEDIDLMHPSKEMPRIPMLGSGTCASLVPSGVNSRAWVECVDGDPILRLQLRFGSRMPSTRYRCEIHPVCSEGIYKSWLLCYESKEEPSPLGSVEIQTNRSYGFVANVTLITFLAYLGIVHLFFLW